MVEPLLSNATCLTARCCSRRCITFSMSWVLTILTVSSSLATATQLPSGERATSRIGNEHLVRTSSSSLLSKEYFETVPSSDPTMKKVSFGSVSIDDQITSTMDRGFVHERRQRYYCLSTHQLSSARRLIPCGRFVDGYPSRLSPVWSHLVCMPGRLVPVDLNKQLASASVS